MTVFDNFDPGPPPAYLDETPPWDPDDAAFAGALRAPRGPPPEPVVAPFRSRVVPRAEGGGPQAPAVDAAAAYVTPSGIPLHSEEEIARTFAGNHANQLRYIAGSGRWMTWDGNSWRVDDMLQVIALIRNLCVEVATVPSASKQAKSIASAKTVRAVEFLARADSRLAAAVDQWDGDPMLLNTPGGVVDLRTAALHKADPALYMTRVTAVAPGGNCPGFLNFLDQIMGGDENLIAYMQRMLGYTLTGDTSAHALFFAYGTGGNGKGVLFDTIAGIFGGYSKQAPIETFAESIGERHPTELAGLQGARLVIASETDEGRRWAEARIKALTGGDKISARFMRQDFFEFQPQFKLLIAGNHKPGLRSVDEAMRRRFHLIPFAVSIPKAERDEHLKDKLKAEWPGILSWMIEGCLRWQQVGLQPPAAVQEATTAYLEAEDLLGAWLVDCCVEEPTAWDLSAALFTSFKSYAERAGEKPGSSKTLNQLLEKRGFRYRRTSTHRGFDGLRLRVQPGERVQ